MLRTKSVKLKTIPAMAFRMKTADGPSITIQRADSQQPGIASLSKTSGQAVPSANTNLKLYPMEAFEEAIKLTNGLPYKKQKGVKVTKEMVKEKKEKMVDRLIKWAKSRNGFIKGIAIFVIVLILLYYHIVANFVAIPSVKFEFGVSLLHKYHLPS